MAYFVIELSALNADTLLIFAHCSESLDNLIGDNFPMKSDEFLVGSPKYNDYIAALDKVEQFWV